METGRAEDRYRNLDMMDIFMILHLPNHKNLPSVHEWSRFLTFTMKSGKLRVKVNLRSFGISVHWYFKAVDVHLKGKYARRVCSIVGGFLNVFVMLIVFEAAETCQSWEMPKFPHPPHSYTPMDYISWFFFCQVHTNLVHAT